MNSGVNNSVNSSPDNKRAGVLGRKKLGRLVTISLALLLLSSLLLFALMSFFVATNAGSRIVLTQLQRWEPRLQLEVSAGDIFGGLQLDRLYWQGEDWQLELESVSASWNSYCLLEWRFCVEELSAQQLQISYLSEENPQPRQEPIDLPALELPLAISVDALELKRLQITENTAQPFIVDAIKINGTVMQGEYLQLQGAEASIDTVTASLSGNIRFTNNYPLAMQLTLAVNPSQAEPLPEISAALSGDLQSLQWHIARWGDYPVASSGALAVIEVDMPVQAQLFLASPYRYPYDQQLVDFSTAKVDLQGYLLGAAQGVDINLEADLRAAYWQGVNQLKGQGRADFSRLSVTDLSLQLPVAAPVNGAGTVNKKNAGRLLASGELDYSEQLQMAWNIRLENIQPELFAELSPGTIDAEIAVAASFDQAVGDYRLQLKRMQGEIAGHALTGEGVLKAEVKGGDNLAVEELLENIEVENLVLRQGDAYILAEGFMGSSDGISWEIHSPALSSIVPVAEGAINASGSIAGSIANPHVAATALLKGFHWQELAITEVGLKLGLAVDTAQLAAGRGKIDLHVKDLQLAPGLPAMNLQLQSRGKLLSQRAQLDIQLGNDIDYQLGCSLSLSENMQELSSICDAMRLRFAESDGVAANGAAPTFASWSLQSPFELQARLSGEKLFVAPFCLSDDKHSDSRVCSQLPVDYSGQKLAALNLQASHMPLAWLRAMLNDEFGIDGEWSLGLETEIYTLSEGLAGLSARAKFASSNSHWRWDLASERDIDFDISELKATAVLQGESLDLRWQLLSPQLGSLRGELIRKNQRLSGNILSDGLHLQPLSALLPARGKLDGLLLSDLYFKEDNQGLLLNGDVRIKDGQLQYADLPLAIDSYELHGAFNGRQAVLGGSVQTGGGSLQLRGSAEWPEEDWLAQVFLDADNLLVHPMYRTDITVSSRLQLDASPHKLHLGGEITIPTARINIRELPASAIRPSADVKLLGAENDDEERWQLTTDVDVALGHDVQFRGFGLYSKLRGGLKINQGSLGPLNGNGVISLHDGRYRAYGQDLLIDEGKMIFAGPIDNPNIIIRAVRNNTDDDVVVGVMAEGDVNNPEVTLFSTPAMSEVDRLHYLLTGRAPSEDADKGSSVAAQMALAMSLRSSNERAQDIAENWGISDFAITTDTGESGQEAQMSGYIGPNLYLKYGYSIFEQISALTARYRLAGNVYVEAYSGKSSFVDFMWRINRYRDDEQQESVISLD